MRVFLFLNKIVLICLFLIPEHKLYIEKHRNVSYVMDSQIINSKLVLKEDVFIRKTARILNALKFLEANVPEFQSLERDLKKDNVQIYIHFGPLGKDKDGYTLGCLYPHKSKLSDSTIFIWYEIIIDTDNIDLVSESDETVIAHEFKHVWDADRVYGFDNFVSEYQDEMAINYYKRPIELSAQRFELKVKKYLKK